MSATGRTAQPDTRAAIAALHGEMSYPAIARRLNLERRFWPALSRIVNGGPVSVEIENTVRDALSLPPLPRLVETVACPDCGGVHNGGRCNGKQVVTLNRPQRTPPPAWVREATENLRRLLEARQS